MSVALKCLYRCPKIDQWSVLNRIFCSLPSKVATSSDKGTPQWLALQARIDLLDLHLNGSSFLSSSAFLSSFFDLVVLTQNFSLSHILMNDSRLESC